MYDHGKLCKIFKEKQCELLTTVDELYQSSTKVPKARFVASCGHENHVFVNVFIYRNTGLICKNCLNEKMRVQNKLLPSGLEKEYRGFLMLRNLLQDTFEVRKVNHGCLSDCCIRKIGIEDDEWVKIQLKTTTGDSYNMYSFNITNNYKDCFIVCIQLEKELFWILDGNEKHNKKLNITRKYSRYDQFKVEKDKIAEFFLDNYDRYGQSGYDDINMPIAKCTQREQEYCRYRESKIDLKFVYPEEEGTVYDFKINEYKFQEKVGTVLKGKRGYGFYVYKNAGKKNGKRIQQLYNIGDNDFYWLNCPDKANFYVIPESAMVMKGFVSKGRCEKCPVLLLNPDDKEHGSWANSFLLNYNKVDSSKLSSILNNTVMCEENHKKRSGKRNAVKVNQYNLDGSYIATFESFSAASIAVGISHTTIRAVCDPKNLKAKTAGGFVWKYHDEHHVTKNRVTTPWSEERIQSYKEIRKASMKKIEKYDLNNTFIETFDNINDLCEMLNYDVSVIRTACQGKKNHKAYGFIWKYKEVV